MLKKTITFDDYNGQQVTEDFYFNLSKAELVELQVSEKEGFAETLQEIIRSNDGQLIIDHFKKIILMAYGKKSPDGRRFIKTQELRDEFYQTEAYSHLFVELATDAAAAAAFINGIVPPGLAQEVQAETKFGEIPEIPTAPPVLEEPVDPRPAWIRENREPTQTELTSMSREQLIEVMRRKNQS